jgi:hypothetical protein
MFKRATVVIACGLITACGGGNSADDSRTTLPSSFNNPPQIGGMPPAIAQVDQRYVFTPSASDADGDTLTFRIENRPEWATFSPSTGRLEGTPPSTAKPVYERIFISVTDGNAFSELPAFDLTVQGVATTNTAPVISGAPSANVVTGNAYEFIPQVVDPDGQALDFAVTGLPTWAEFDSATGRLWGTPGAGDIGAYAGIVISVSDGVATASLPEFSIDVTSGTPPGSTNRSPVISGSPTSSVTVGQAYSFTPSASDPDGQALTFSITNKPSWATFSTSTGRLNGTPAAANAGTYSGIVISVSDGSASASLPSFTLTVQQVQLGSATISWTPPTENTNDTALTNLKGYRIYYGTSSGNLNQMLDLPNAGISNGVVENLAPGTWYFGVKSYNTSNVESALSNITSKTIN